MSDQILAAIAFCSALGAGIIGGVFFAFSTFVMRGLSRVPASEGISAMQAINIAVINPVFLGVFLGTAALCAMSIVAAMLRWQRPGAAYLLAAALLYVVGSFLVTMICNVPLNNALANLTPAHANAADQWADYLRRWTIWNHLRMLASVASSGCFIMAMIRS